MTEELQSLLEKIKREGVDKAEAEAKCIREKATAEAAALVKAAEEKAAACEKAAEEKAAREAERAQETIRQAARDTLLGVQDALTALLTRLLAKEVDGALSDAPATGELVRAALRALVTGDTPAEIHAEKALAESLRAALAQEKNITVVTDETAQTGFSIRLEEGRVEHDFTGPTLAKALAARLRPEIARLVTAP